MCFALSWVACQVQTLRVSGEQKRREGGRRALLLYCINFLICLFLFIASDSCSEQSTRRPCLSVWVCACMCDDRYTVFSSSGCTGQLSL